MLQHLSADFSGPTFRATCLGLAFLGLVVCRPLREPPPQLREVARRPVVVDGLFDDWKGARFWDLDPPADGRGDGVDLRSLWLAHDGRFLFVRFQTDREIVLQESELVLAFDSDADTNTGVPIFGQGAELVWRFSGVDSLLMRDGRPVQVSHADLGLVAAPTTSADGFEVAIDLEALPEGASFLKGEGFRLVIAEELPAGDRMPDAGALFARLRHQAPGAVGVPSTLPAKDNAQLRFLTYNIEKDRSFESGRRPAFGRILQAIAADVIGLQEVYEHSAAETAALVEEVWPQSSGWHHAKVGLDLVVLSRYEIRRSTCLAFCDDFGSVGAFLIDGSELWNEDLLLILMHLPCCRGGEPDADRMRQLAIDQALAFLREAREDWQLSAATPILVAGDMNLVGDRRQLAALTEGEIFDIDSFGPRFAPDGDGTALRDLLPRHLDLPMTFTWRRPDGPFPPGRLDFILYSDSVLAADRGFVLYTPAMAASALMDSGLEREDTTALSDHLPVVGDFSWRSDAL